MVERYSKLISGVRLRQSTLLDRSLSAEMLSDKGRIVLSTAFRRLQTKAQVFSLEQNAAVRTRLTHTLEVAVFGQLIAEQVFQALLKKGSIKSEFWHPFITTVENACFLHDIGNPPFGHLGEFAIREWFRINADNIHKAWEQGGVRGTLAAKHFAGFANFDGNAQGFRIVSRLQWLRDEYGFNLTCTLLASMLKYLVPNPTDRRPFGRKIGYFETERELVLQIWNTLGLKVDYELPAQRHPFAFLMEAADDIAYSVSDIEDAIEKHIVSEEELLNLVSGPLAEFKVAEDDLNQEDLSRSARFSIFRINLVRSLVEKAATAFVEHEEEILEGGFRKQLLEIDKTAYDAKLALRGFAEKYIYTSREAVEIELSGYRIISDILTGFLPLIQMSPKEFGRLHSDTTNPPRYGELALESRLYSLLPNKHLKTYRHHVRATQANEHAEEIEPVLRTHLILGNLVGMTDSHAVKVFNMINGTSSAAVI